MLKKQDKINSTLLLAGKKKKELCLLQHYWSPCLSDLWLWCSRGWRLYPRKGCGGQKLVERRCGTAMLGKNRGCECPFCTLGLNERLCSWGSECRLCPRGGRRWSRKKVGSILGKRHLLVLQLGGSLLSRALVCGCCDRQWDCTRGSCQSTEVWLCSPLASRWWEHVEVSGCVLHVNYLGLFKAEN